LFFGDNIFIKSYLLTYLTSFQFVRDLCVVVGIWTVLWMVKLLSRRLCTRWLNDKTWHVVCCFVRQRYMYVTNRNVDTQLCLCRHSDLRRTVRMLMSYVTETADEYNVGW